MSNKLSKQQVEYIANLARIGLSEEEKEYFQGTLGSVLSFIDKLQEIDVKNIEPTAHISGIENETRDDENGFRQAGEEALLKLAPHKKDNYIKVRKVL